MTNLKITKGRPKGSEKDDNAVLTALADMIFANPALRPTTAMRHFRRKATDAEIRRWQSKWRDRKEALLALAAARDEAKRQRDTNRGSGGSSRRTSLAELAAMGGLPDTRIMRMARGLDISPAMKAIEAYQNSPAMRLAREIENNPAVRLMRQLEDNGIMKIVRQQQEMADRLARYGFF
jgi:hypothetical protein